MIMFIKKVLKIFVIALVIGFAFSVVAFLSDKLIWSQDKNYITQGISAFMGAAAVSLFGVIGWLIVRISNRQIRSYNALIRAESLLNNYLNNNGDNLSIVQNAQRSFEKEAFHVLNFKKYEIDKEILFDFTYLDLINEYFEINVDLHRHNESFKTILSIYTDVKEAIFSGRINEQSKKENLHYLKGQLLSFEKAINLLNAKTIDVLCSVRILIRKEQPLIVSLFRNRYSKKHKQEVEKERKELEREISDIGERSRKELQAAGLEKNGLEP